MGPTDLSDALVGLSPPSDPQLLVGIETSDDAAVYRLSNEIAMINTVDFITPPVDDPYWFGQIAAANSISDIYAMGGTPVTALNLVMFPAKHLDMGILREILRGGHDKVVEAGASLAGGHSVDDEEPKYGLCVNGIVHPERILTNSGARPGDTLVLTKPLGTGVLFNAVRSGKMPYRDVEENVLPTVASLNRAATEEAQNFEIHACTDITGFGIAGHLSEMANASGTEITLQYSALPIYPGTLNMYRKGETTGSNDNNRRMVEAHTSIRSGLSHIDEELLFDPQTSGGLLLSLPNDQADRFLAGLRAAGVIHSVSVGHVEEGPAKLVIE
ncbi:MAG: selenide, water dikinase SelD [bacterium]|nr:selenide, water dikinase SelD [bacterium]